MLATTPTNARRWPRLARRAGPQTQSARESASARSLARRASRTFPRESPPSLEYQQLSGIIGAQVESPQASHRYRIWHQEYRIGQQQIPESAPPEWSGGVSGPQCLGV
jgi:hypothetical protein